ncbi:basigin-like [Clavelina lepadiformis]|uniref:basigin-like n=1 Tax=Clavelina lepadiformis TaxID=159417 RepID=UPI0040435B77
MNWVFIEVVLFTLVIVQCSSQVTATSETVVLSSTTSTNNPVLVYCNGLNEPGSNDNITWEYTNATGTSRMLSETSSSFNLTSTSDVGEYTCNLNGNPVHNITAAYLAKPTLEHTQHSVTFNDGDKKRKLTCTCVGSYPAVTFEWSRRSEDKGALPVTLSSGGNITIETSSERSVLTFNKLKYNMQAYYECQVMNSAGNQTVEVHVRVKDRLAALWPFLGIVSEVVILIIIIFTYEKRSKKAAAKASRGAATDDAETPLKANDETGTELRNRSSANNKDNC